MEPTEELTVIQSVAVAPVVECATNLGGLVRIQRLTLDAALGLSFEPELLPNPSTITAIAYHDLNSTYHVYTDDALLYIYHKDGHLHTREVRNMTGVLGDRPVDAAAFISTAPTPFRLELSGYSVYKDGVYRGEITPPAPCGTESSQHLIKILT